MSGGGGKGGSQTQTTQVEIPKWLQRAAQSNIARAEQIAQLGYTPYYGPDVAALTPMQQAAFANTGTAAGAFGLPGGGLSGMEGMPQAMEYAGGVQGYSSAPIYNQSLAALQEHAPGQAEYLAGMFIDPVTGQPGSLFGSQPANAQPAPMYSGMQPAIGNRSDSWNGAQMEQQGGVANVAQPSGGSGGGGSPVDLIDGGGLGASGSTFQGAGLYSDLANIVASPVERDGGGGQGGK